MLSFSKCRAWLSGLLLRGSVLRFWLRRRMRRLNDYYFRRVIESAARGPVPEVKLRRSLRVPVRNILFITDDQWEQAELVPELKKICEVDSLNLRSVLKAVPRGRSEAEAVTAAVGERAKRGTETDPSLIFFYARSPMLSENVFNVIRQRWACPLIGMNLDDKIEFWDYNLFSYRRDNYIRWAKHFDVNLTNGKLAADWYRDRGLPVYYMAQGCHQKVPPPPDRPQFKYNITFLGRWRPERGAMIRQLRELGVPIQPFGGGWPGSGEVDVPEHIYQASQINFGSGYASPSETLTTTKGRDIECTAAGACYLTTFNWELGEHFDIGKEILCYRSIEEAVEIYSYYHRRPEECLKIAHAAYQRCQRDHTWEKRFRELFHRMDFS